jgi:hypothetical protein
MEHKDIKDFGKLIGEFITRYMTMIRCASQQCSKEIIKAAADKDLIEKYSKFNLEQHKPTKIKMLFELSDNSIMYDINICAVKNCKKFVKDVLSQPLNCINNSLLPDFSDWGLPGNLGLPRTNISSSNTVNLINAPNLAKYNGQNVPRFYYGDIFPGDNGYWLLPNSLLPNSLVQWVECPFKINFMGPGYMYMEIAGQNCIDETSPYNNSTYTLTTNSTNGVANSAFAKISVPTTPIAQWFDRDSLPYKFYYPPAERMRKFSIKIRYHNGKLVNFGQFNYSFAIEFTLQLPQLLRSSNSVLYPPPNYR